MDAGPRCWTSSKETSCERTVVLLDEAGMAATHSTERLLGTAQRAGAKVIAIGDSGQLSSVQAGGWMRAVRERVGMHRLTQVMRQRDAGERRALAQPHDGRPGPYLRWAQEHERVAVHTSDDDQRACNAALEDCKQAAAEHSAAAAVLIGLPVVTEHERTQSGSERGGRTLRSPRPARDGD